MKLAASCLLVLVHVTFPGKYGYLVECIGRFGVPFFFAVSGYYSYKTTSDRYPKRIKKLFSVLLITDIIYICWGIFSNVVLSGGSLREYLTSLMPLNHIARFFFLDNRTDHMTFHMWYITAEIKVYIALFVYQIFTNNCHNYKPLYLTAASAFMFFIIFGINGLASGQKFDISITRNSLFYAFPLVMSGVFQRQYEKNYFTRFRLTRPRLLLIIVFGMLATFLECFGIGRSEMALGMLPVVWSTILLLTGFPIPDTALTNRLSDHIRDIETMSLIVYIIHPLAHYICSSFDIPEKLSISYRFYPLMVLFISLGASIIYCLTRKLFYVRQK